MKSSITKDIEKNAIPENEGKEIHLGYRMEKSLTSADIDELIRWNTVSGSLREVEVNKVYFTINIYPDKSYM